MSYSHIIHIQLYTETYSTIMTNEHTSLEKYTSHTLFSKGLMLVICKRWVRDEDRLPHIDIKFLCMIAALLPHSAGLLNRGPEGPSPLSGAGSHYGILSPTATETRTVTATRTELFLPRTPTAPNCLWHLVI